jgi:hypothetical protein
MIFVAIINFISIILNIFPFIVASFLVFLTVMISNITEGADAAITLPTYTWEVLGSNLGPEMFNGFLLSNSLFTNHPTIRHYVISATDSFQPLSMRLDIY